MEQTNKDKAKPLFTIIVVSLNPGDKLIATMESIRRQTFGDYQVVVKDGGSEDGSMERLAAYLERWQEGASRVKAVVQQDGSIYEGMNQAYPYAEGDYLWFLNCGDLFAADDILAAVAGQIRQYIAAGREAKLYYGDVRDMQTGQVVTANPNIDAFACYRHLPCHQACLYARELFAQRGYDPAYLVRADYEHFLWCYFVEGVRPKYLAMTLADYEGGGFSESRENIRRSAAEHRAITALYMSGGQRLRYRLLLFLSLAPLRRRLAQSKTFAGIYQRCKALFYGRA